MRPCVFVALQTLFFSSGVVALTCEVIWTRWLTGVIGSASAATAIVLAVFMGGLGAGSWISAKMSDRSNRPIRVYAALELCIAVTAALILVELKGVAFVLEGLAHWLGPVSPVLDATRFLAAIITIGPPTVLMGASLPLLVKATADSGDVLGRRTASLYAINSLGGVAGTLLVGFFLIEAVGMWSTALLAIGLSVVIAILAFLLDHAIHQQPTGRIDRELAVPGSQEQPMRRQRKQQRRAELKVQPLRPQTQTDGRWILLAAALAGFSALGYENVWSRVLTLLTLNTTYAFSLMLAILLLGLALGSWFIRSYLDRERDTAVWFAVVQVSLALYASLSLLWAPSLVEVSDALVSAAGPLSLPAWFAKPMMLATCLLLPPAILMGASLPIACKLYASIVGGIGQPVGRVYACNTAGSVVGASVIGLLAIPFLGTSWAMGMCSTTGALSGVWLAWHFAESPRRKTYASVGSTIAGVAISFGVLFGSGTVVENQSLRPDEKIVFRSEDAYGLVEVTEDKQHGMRWMLTNRLHWEGSTLPRGVAEQRKQGLLPLVLHDSPRRVLEIGLGTGIKLSSLHGPVVERAVAVELSPAVIEASRLFRNYNHNISSSDSQVEIICADGRNFVALTPERYDLIINGLLTPYRAGVSRLYTVEHFRNCRAKLTDDGMFVVWVALRQLSPNDLQVLTHTLLEVFPETTMWLDGYYLALVSTKGPLNLDVDALLRRCEDKSLVNALREAGLDSPFPLLATFLAGPHALASFAGDQPLNTEDRPVIEFRSPRLGERLNTSDLAAEMLGMLSLLQEPLHPKYLTANPTSAAKVLSAQHARWTARQGLIAKNYGNHVQAAQLFKAALAQDASDDLARYEMEVYLVAHAKQCLDRGLFDQARHVLQQAVKVNPRSVGALGSLAAFEERAGNGAEASRLWERALSVDPHNGDIRRRVASAGSTSGRY